MFTGIVETHTPVLSTSNETLKIERPKIFTELFIGQSIACNGACLSVAKYSDSSISFDVLTETFRKTNLATSQRVNVERAMPANGRFEGHIVLGHVDCCVPLLSIEKEESGIEYIFATPPEKKYLVEKGSLCINGVSLTISNITDSSFSVYLIPLTLEHTNLGILEEGDLVSIEYDYLGKLVLANK